MNRAKAILMLPMLLRLSLRAIGIVAVISTVAEGVAGKAGSLVATTAPMRLAGQLLGGARRKAP